MKSNQSERKSAIAVALIALGLGWTAGAFAEHRCKAPQDAADRGACAAARQGPTALRQYVQRTQSIYHLDYFDYAPRDEAWWRMADAARTREQPRADVARAARPDK